MKDHASLLRGYQDNYGAPHVTWDMAQEHLALETRLARELRESKPAERAEVFERCYNELYASLPWLASTGAEPSVGVWRDLLGPPPQHVYEVGSGSGKLAMALATSGYSIEATDISEERGGDRPEVPGLTWSVTDGIALSQFALAAPYDAVISDQLLEHLHPDDVVSHMREAHAILKPGGRYILRTPHQYTGPHDMSRLFGYNEAVGMHLHEYTNSELRAALKDAGFSRVMCGAYVPGPTKRAAVAARAITPLAIGLERALAALPPARRKAVSSKLRGPLQPRILIVAERS